MSEKLIMALQNYKQSGGLMTNIKSIANEHCKELKNASNAQLGALLESKMSEILLNLKEQNLDSSKNLKSAMEGVNQALVSGLESELFTLIGEQERLARAVEQKRDEIKNTLRLSFEAAERVANANEFACKDEILALLNSAIIRETRMFGILKESVQSAFLTTLERGDDIDEMSAQIAKNTTYEAIIEGEFSKERILEIARTIILAACELANEGQIFANKLVAAAISGSKEGVARAIERLKEQAKFAPDEAGLKHGLAQLKNVDESFIQMLKALKDESEGVAKEEIELLLGSELDTNLARIKRASEQASELIRNRLDELRESELVASANEKLDALKTELNERASKLKADFEVGEKIDELKREIAELEKKANEKFDEIRQMDLKNEAKKFGDRAYNAAKSFLLGIKKDKD